MSNQWAKALLCSVLLSFWVNPILAQYENIRWVFGIPSLEVVFNPYNNFNPVVLSLYQQNPYAREGCAVATDRVTGELLFYTNGETIYNKNHQPMPNGNGLGVLETASQAVSLAPVPGSCSKFYVIVLNAPFSNIQARWSIVDMDLDNGLGDVEIGTKNTLIHDRAGEANIIIQRPGFDEYWLITTQDSLLTVHAITASGINYHSQYNNGAGPYMIFNAAHSTVLDMVATCYTDGLRMNEFNSNTGVFSTSFHLNNYLLYDAEFSPDGSKVYFAAENGDLRQYDFYNNQETLIYQYFPSYPSGGGLTTGPDGKIYYIINLDRDYVSVINQPNNPGLSCNFSYFGFSLGRTLNSFNFPNTLPRSINKFNSSITAQPNPCAAYAAIAQGNNGQAPYNYEWSNWATGDTLRAINPGTYYVTISDAGGCKIMDSVFISQSINPFYLNPEIHGISCAGTGAAAVYLNPSGGTPPYTTVWGDGNTDTNRFGLSAGTYSVTVSDAGGCSESTTINIVQPAPIVATETHTDATCGNANGTITITTSGGQAGYTYDWNDGNTTQNRTDLAAGTYTVTVTDDSSCTATVSVSIGQNNGPAISLSASNVSCYGDNDGSVAVATTGGTAPYTYLWSNWETTDTIINLIAGTYTVTATDSTGCTGSDSITILQPDAIDITIFPLDTIAAGESVTLQINSQTNPGTTSYLWEPATGLSCTDCAEPTANIEESAFYTLTIINNGCIASDSIWITVVADTAINDTISLYIPTAFSPNNDGKNDVYYIYGKGIKNISWSVFDRWGELVFTSNDINTGWDGTRNIKKYPPGTFVIDVNVEFIDFSKVHKTQSILLIR